MNIVNSAYLKTKFPEIKYAFISNYIIRTSRIRKLKEQEKPIVDTILVCEDIDAWHKQNFKMNKSHYPLIAKYTSYKLVTYFQRKGAKIHFNYFTTEEGKLLRYGVVGWEDFTRDLDFWRTLTVSTYMHKPFDVVIENFQVYPHQTKNLTSAVCIGALFNLKEGVEQFVVSEKEFYDTIIKIPLIQGSLFKIFDDKDVNFELDDIIQEFRNIYLPIIEDLSRLPAWEDFINFNEVDSTFTIKNNLRAKKFFLDHLNLGIYRELSYVSHVPDSFEDKVASRVNSDEKSKYKLLYQRNNIETKERINKAINDILTKHRNTKIFLILMGKWFFFAFILFKYFIKVIIIYAIYKKSGKLHIPFFSSNNHHEHNEESLKKHEINNQQVEDQIQRLTNKNI